MNDNNELSTLKTELAVLSRDVSNANEYIKRLDIAIDKIATISSDISTLIKVHDNRLQKMEDSNNLLFKKVEERRISQEESNEKNLNLLMDIKKEMDERITVLHEKDHQILERMDDFKTEAKSNHEMISKKIEQHEKIRWLVVGGATVAFFVLQYIFAIVDAVSK